MLINELPWLPDIPDHQYTMRCKEIRGAFSHHCWAGVGGPGALNLGRWLELCSCLLLDDQSDAARRKQLSALNTTATSQPCALKRFLRKG